MPFAVNGIYTPATGATSAIAGDIIYSATWNAIHTDLSNALTLLGQQLYGTTSVTTATYVPVATDALLLVNRPNIVSINLPTAASRAGYPLAIKDISGTANTNNITITPNGAETIEGAASLVINMGYGSYMLHPVSGGWIRVDSTTDATDNAAAVTLTNKTISLASNTVSYLQTGTGAVSSPMISRFSNSFYAHEFGAVGDDATNDYAALQAGITAAVTAGAEFHLDPGKKYFVSGNDLTIAVPSGCMNFEFYGNGAQIRTNSAQARTGLKVQHVAAVTRADETRKVRISGVTIRQFSDANALYGINVIGSTHVTIEGCSFLAGSDTGTANQVNHACIRFGQSDSLNPDTGSFWCRVLNNDFKGGTTKGQHCVFFQGGSNAVTIENNTFSNSVLAIWMKEANTGLNANEAVIANGVRIVNNDFEDCTYGVYVQGTAAWSHLEGLIVSNNRIETIGTVFFNYLLNVAAFSPPIIGPNYIDSGSWPPKYISSANALVVDVRDEFIADKTVDPANILAGATSAFTTVAISPAAVGDHVTADSTANLQGLVLTGYVSGANTVTLRLTNATSGAVDLGSMKFLVRVRPQY